MAASAFFVVLALLLVPAGASAQAIDSECGYANPGSGPLAENICWIDFTGYSEATSRTAAGQDITVAIPGGYTATFNVFTSGSPSTFPGVNASNLPMGYDPGGSAINNPARTGSYTGVPGRPAISAWMNNGQAITVTLRNIVVRDAEGNPVTGYSVLAADAEFTEVYERITWTADQPWDLVARLQPPPPGLPQNGCQNTATGFGTTTVVCQGAIENTGPQNYGSVLIKADSATTVSATLAEIAPFSRFGGQTSAFAFVTSKVEVAKEVEGRVRPTDSFDVSATSPEDALVGSETTAGADAATTGELTVLPRSTGDAYTLAEAATPDTNTRLEDYSQSWSCTNNGVAMPSLDGDGLTRDVAPEPGDDIECTVTNTQLDADPTIVKRSAQDWLIPNREATFEFDVTNNGPSRATNVVVSDELPEHFEFVSASDGCTAAAGVLTCTIDLVDVDETKTVSVTGIVQPSVGECMENTATVDSDTPDANEENNASTICPRVAPDPVIEKTGPTTIAPNGELKWTVTVTNNGPGRSMGSTLTDKLPAGVTDVRTDTTGCVVTPATMTCDIDELAEGESRKITLFGKAPATFETCFTNEVEIKDDEFDHNTSNNKANVQTCTPEPKYTLDIDKTVSAPRSKVGDTVTYTAVAKNNGPDPAPDATVTDKVPSQLDALSATSTQGTCSLKGNTVTCELGPMAAGATATVTIIAISRRVGDTTNNASVSSSKCQTKPCDTGGVPHKIGKGNLKLTKNVNRKKLSSGQNATYTIKVRNPTDVELNDVEVCDDLPSGLVYVSSSPRAKLTRGKYCWTLKTLGAGKGKTFKMTVRALDGASGKKVNRAIGSSPNTRKVKDTASLRLPDASVKAGGVTG